MIQKCFNAKMAAARVSGCQWQQSPSTPAFSTSHAALRARTLFSRLRLKSVMHWYGYLTFYVSDFVRPFLSLSAPRRLFRRLPLAAASDRAMTKAPALLCIAPCSESCNHRNYTRLFLLVSLCSFLD
jgi:hypothetical protein